MMALERHIAATGHRKEDVVEARGRHQQRTISQSVQSRGTVAVVARYDNMERFRVDDVMPRGNGTLWTPPPRQPRNCTASKDIETSKRKGTKSSTQGKGESKVCRRNPTCNTSYKIKLSTLLMKLMV